MSLVTIIIFLQDVKNCKAQNLLPTAYCLLPTANFST
jgi:hypothetical protein